MQQDLLFYIDFDRKDFYTLIGGIRTNAITIEREPVQTEDKEKHYRILIPGSGITIVDVEGNGVMEDNEEMFKRLHDFINTSKEAKVRLRSNEIWLEGFFIITSFEITSETNDAKNFSIRLMSSGEVINRL